MFGAFLTRRCMQTLAEDIIALWHAMFTQAAPAQPSASQATVSTEPSPGTTTTSSMGAAGAGDPLATLIVGHSMGGGIAVWASQGKRIPSLAGCVVIDVVEGTAIGGWQMCHRQDAIDHTNVLPYIGAISAAGYAVIWVLT